MTGEFVNIPAAYADPRFNQDTDCRTGSKTKSLLCCPVLFKDEIIAVAELSNKRVKEEYVAFAEKDEFLFRVFASFAGVVLANALKLVDLHNNPSTVTSHTVNVASDAQVAAAMAIALTQEEKASVLAESFSIHDYAQQPKHERLIPLCVHLFEHLNFLETFKVPRAKFFRFVLTAAATYNEVPYHNFTHAFDVTHTAFLYLTKNNMKEELL